MLFTDNIKKYKQSSTKYSIAIDQNQNVQYITTYHVTYSNKTKLLSPDQPAHINNHKEVKKCELIWDQLVMSFRENTFSPVQFPELFFCLCQCCHKNITKKALMVILPNSPWIPYAALKHIQGFCSNGCVKYLRD